MEGLLGNELNQFSPFQVLDCGGIDLIYKFLILCIPLIEVIGNGKREENEFSPESPVEILESHLSLPLS